MMICNVHGDMGYVSFLCAKAHQYVVMQDVSQFIS